MKRSESISDGRIVHIEIRCFFQKPCQATIGIETIFFHSPDHGEQDRTAAGSAGCICEQKSFPSDDEWFYTTFRPVIGYSRRPSSSHAISQDYCEIT